MLIKRSLNFWILPGLINFMLIFAVYHVKYNVLELERACISMEKKYEKLAENAHILSAEYTFLSNPKRLATLAQKYLDKKYKNPEHLQHVSSGKLAYALDLKKPLNTIPVSSRTPSPIHLVSYEKSY